MERQAWITCGSHHQITTKFNYLEVLQKKALHFNSHPRFAFLPKTKKKKKSGEVKNCSVLPTLHRTHNTAPELRFQLVPVLLVSGTTSHETMKDHREEN